MENASPENESGSTAAGRHKGRLRLALLLTATFMLAEVIGGLCTGSLALLADAAHMMTDAGGLILALIAIRFSERPRTPKATFGYARMEILSALLNSVVLLLLTVYILFEAYRRYLSPPEIIGGPMLVVAVIGLAVNLISMRILAAGSKESLNVQGAYFEVLADMLGSLGVIVAAVVVLLTGWNLVDPLIGAGIGLLIVPRTWILLRQAVHILMEGTPPEIDMSLLEVQLLAISGVVDVHDLHVWTVTSGFNAMSGHIVISNGTTAADALSAAQERLKSQFQIDHLTIQVETENYAAVEAPRAY